MVPLALIASVFVFVYFPLEPQQSTENKGDGATLIGLALIIDVLLLTITHPDEEIEE